MNIKPIKALSDNYIWVIEEGREAIIIDPGESAGVLDYLEDSQLTVKAILLTHKHHDHVDGVADILVKFPDTPVYGPEEIGALTNHVVRDGDSVELFGKNFQIFITAGHTEGHISYLMDNNLFCGDALFSAGCGRVFTGDYQAQYDALQKFSTLADDIKVFGAHEYTQTNLRFSQSIEADNQKIATALDEVNQLRVNDELTLPSTIGKEKDINLFLQAKSLDDFIALRNARDAF